MPMIDARNFLKSLPVNNNLREELNRATSRKEMLSILKDASFDFTFDEIDEAYRALLVQCQNEEIAGHLEEIKNWWDLLVAYTPDR